MSAEFKSRKSWREKLENPPKGLPKVVSGPASWEKWFGGRRVLVPTPLLVDGLIRKVPKGKLITTKVMIDKFNKKHKVDFTCPLTTGIFVSILANVAEEQLEMGKSQKDVVPYWRVVKPPKGYLYDKYLGMKSKQRGYLKKEGFKEFQAGQKRVLLLKTLKSILCKILNSNLEISNKS